MLAPEDAEVDDVEKPSQDPYSVRMDRAVKKSKKQPKDKKASDDTPIMIGEAQDKSAIIRRLKSYQPK